MKAIVDNESGKLLYTTTIEVQEVDSVTVIEGEPAGNHWDFDNQTWYTYIPNEDLERQALDIDLLYTSLISDLLRKHIEKLNIDGVPVPRDVIQERDRLREECNAKILALGITNFTYRNSNLRL